MSNEVYNDWIKLAAEFKPAQRVRIRKDVSAILIDSCDRGREGVVLYTFKSIVVVQLFDGEDNKIVEVTALEVEKIE